MAALVRAELERLGYAVEVDALGNVTGTLDAGPGPCVLLDAHMDTVGVTDPAAWSADPAGELRDGRLYGRGSVDMKGPLAALMHGAAAAPLARGRVVVSASIAEEMIEGYATVAVARRVQPDVAVICEPSHRTVVVGQRGRAELVVQVQGSPAHSSRPDLGVNAVEAMADVLRAARTIELPSHPQVGAGDPRSHRDRQPPVSGVLGAAGPMHGHLRSPARPGGERGGRAGGAPGRRGRRRRTARRHRHGDARRRSLRRVTGRAGGGGELRAGLAHGRRRARRPRGAGGARGRARVLAVLHERQRHRGARHPDDRLRAGRRDARPPRGRVDRARRTARRRARLRHARRVR